tara:strand:+ start:3294 stop:3746 length:453 start_codon:yes stop_codon:yes gene_type:complete
VSGCVLKACRLYARFNFRSSFASARDRPNTLAAFEFPSVVRISFFIIVVSTLLLLPLVLLLDDDETDETETPNVVVLWPRPDGGNFPNEHFPKNPPPPEEEEQHAAVLVVALVLPKVAAHVKAAAPPTTTETIVEALLSFLHYSAKENQK